MDQTSRTPIRTERRRALGGALILAALVGLAVLIVSLDAILAARTPTVEVRAILAETGGLAAGAPVRIAGHEVGAVAAVTLLPPGPAGDDRVLAVARVPREHFGMLRRDSRARITRPGFVGDPLLELSPGSAGAPALTPGDTIRAEFAPERVEQALGDTRRALRAADSLVADLRVVSALYRERRPDIDRVARSVAEANAELERTRAAFAGGPLHDLLTDPKLRDRFARVRTGIRELRAGLERYGSGPLRTRFDALAARADALQTELARLDSLASAPTGTVGRLRADSALAVARVRAQAQFDSLVEEVRSNPMMFF